MSDEGPMDYEYDSESDLDYDEDESSVNCTQLLFDFGPPPNPARDKLYELVGALLVHCKENNIPFESSMVKVPFDATCFNDHIRFTKWATGRITIVL